MGASKTQIRNTDVADLTMALNPESLDMDNAKALREKHNDWYTELQGKVGKGKKLNKDEQKAYDAFSAYDAEVARQAEAAKATTSTNPQVAETYADRIKAGKATDEDMKTAYEDYKAGKYSPGPKTLEAFKAMETTQPNTQMEQARRAIPTSFDLGNGGTPSNQSSKGNNYGVDKENGKIGSYESLGNMFMDAQDKNKAYKDVKSVYDDKMKSYNTTKSEYQNILDKNEEIGKKANVFEKSFQGTIDKQREKLEAERAELESQKSAIQREIEAGIPDDIDDTTKGALEATKQERMQAQDSLQPIADALNSINGDVNLTPEQKLENINKLIEENSAQLSEISSVVIQDTVANMDTMRDYIGKYGSKDDIKGFQTIENLVNQFANLMNTDEPLTESEIDQLKKQISLIDEAIQNDPSTEALRQAKRDRNSAISKFVRFAFQDLAAFALIVIGIAGGDSNAVQAGFNLGINRLNNAYADSEAKMKTNTLQAKSENDTRDITAESVARFQKIQNDVELDKILEEANISASEKARLQKANAEAYEEYKKSLDKNGMDYGTWIEAQKGNKSWADLGSSVISILSGLIGNAREGHAEGGIIGQTEGASMGPDNTVINAREGEMVLNADQQKRLFDILDGKKAVDTKGKTGNIMDGILSRGKTQKEQPKEEVDLSKSPAMKMSKQQMLSNALSQRNPQALQNQQPQQKQQKQQKGWGKA